MIETCCGTYERTRNGFEKLLEEWMDHAYDPITNSIVLPWLPWDEFENFTPSWLQRATKKLSRLGYPINKHTVFNFQGGFETSDGFDEILEEING